MQSVMMTLIFGMACFVAGMYVAMRMAVNGLTRAFEA